MKVTLYTLLFTLLLACSGSNNKKQAATAKESVVVTINESNFDTETNSGLVLVDFWAEWCPPCRQLSPVLDNLTTHYDGQLKLVKINVDNNAELSQRFNIKSIPTLLLKKDGEIVERFMGFRSLEELQAIVDKYR